MDNQHRQISGYRDLTQQEIDAINSIKSLEQDTANLFKQLSAVPGVDVVALEVAKTSLKTGFFWMVHSVGRPFDPFANN